MRDWHFFSFSFCLLLFFRTTPVAYGSSQARSQISELYLGHSNVGSKPQLQLTPQLTATPNHQPTDWGQGSNRILMDTSWVHYHWATLGIPDTSEYIYIYIYIKFLNIYVYIYMHTHIYIHTYTHIYVYAHTYIYTHTHTQRNIYSALYNFFLNSIK